MKKYIKITCGNTLICTLEEAIELLKNMYEEEDDSEFAFQIVEMTDEEYNKLEEFDGF